MRKSWIAALLPLVFVTGCGTQTTSNAEDTVLVAHGAERAAPSATAPVTELVAGLDAFGHDLLGATDARGNVVMSPLSIGYAFGMLDAGARGETAAQLERVLHLPATERHEALNALLQQVAPAEQKQLSLANALFVQRGLKTRAEFLRTLTTQYGAGARQVDFGTGRAAATINDWVRTETRNKIPKLFDTIPQETAVVLANAIHLKATWASPFQRELTKPEVFHRAAGPVRVPMMNAEEPFRYAAGAGWQAVELGYADGDLAMWVLVPKGRTAPRDLLTAEVLRSVGKGLTADGGVAVALPRWSFGTEIQLPQPLQRLGMTDAFSDATADLTGIGGRKGDLFVGQAVHRATITVDEKGTEAAAVTGVGVEASSATVRNHTVRADRPFAFAIVHEPTGAPVFTGVVADPSVTAGDMLGG